MEQQSAQTPRAREMFAIIEKYLSSGLSRKEFCDKESITYSTFHWWFHQYRKNNPSMIKASPKDFIRVQAPSREASLNLKSSCVVEFPNGVKIHFSGEINTSIIAQLAKIQAD